MDNIIDEIKNVGVISNDSQVDRETGAITSNLGYVIEGKLDNYLLLTVELAGDVLKIDSTATDEADKSPYVTYNGLTCRVLYNDDTHGLQIITADSVESVTLGYEDSMVTSSDFTYDGSATVDDNFLKAAASYNNVVDNLNNKAKYYIDEKGIATDARCLGSIPTLTSDSKFQGDTSGMWTASYDYLTTYGWNNKFKTTDTNSFEDLNQLKTLGLNVFNLVGFSQCVPLL